MESQGRAWYATGAVAEHGADLSQEVVAGPASVLPDPLAGCAPLVDSTDQGTSDGDAARCELCSGVSIEGAHCIEHVTPDEFLAAVARLRDGASLIAREVHLSARRLIDLLTELSVDGECPTLLHADFGGAVFTEDTAFDMVTFRGDTQFAGATFVGRASFDCSLFRGNAVFDGATFEREATFFGVTFCGEATFKDANFVGAVTVDATAFCGPTAFDGATFGRLRLRPEHHGD